MNYHFKHLYNPTIILTTNPTIKLTTAPGGPLLTFSKESDTSSHGRSTSPPRASKRIPRGSTKQHPGKNIVPSRYQDIYDNYWWFKWMVHGFVSCQTGGYPITTCFIYGVLFFGNWDQPAASTHVFSTFTDLLGKIHIVFAGEITFLRSTGKPW